MTTLLTRPPDLPASAAYYTRASLRLYDAFVYRFTTPYAWRCNREVIAEHYRTHINPAEHAEVGVGTGYVLAHLDVPINDLTLIDPNPDALARTTARLAEVADHIGTHEASILDAVTLPRRRFKSVAANYLLHCLAGPMRDKEPAIAHLADLTADDGTLFGATVLGDDADHNPLGHAVMAVCNATGAFGNRTDTVAELRAQLERHFAVVDIMLWNTVALFAASAPIRSGQRPVSGHPRTAGSAPQVGWCATGLGKTAQTSRGVPDICRRAERANPGSHIDFPSRPPTRRPGNTESE